MFFGRLGGQSKKTSAPPLSALTLHHWNRNLSEHWDDTVRQVGFERAKV